MEAPDLSKVDKEIREYIEGLEERLEMFTSETTIANFYIGLKKQVDDISVLFMTLEMTLEDLKDKDDKFVDRYFKYLEKSKVIAENLTYISKLVAPEKITKAKIRKDAIAEKHIFEHQSEKE